MRKRRASGHEQVMAGMARAIAIFLGALAVAAAIAFVFRWQIAANASAVYLLDRWTGRVAECREPLLGRQMECF